MKSGLFAIALLAFVGRAGAIDFAREIRPLLEQHCTDCHDDSSKPKGGLNLERFTDEAAVMHDRGVWKTVFDQLEARMMPPPKRDEQPTEEQRARLLAWTKRMLARPEPALGARDPGRPVLRRLTRLEYNNSVRDLFGLKEDIFLFPERQPLKKEYFQPATGRMPDQLEVRMLEYGAKRPVLLPQSGLPGDGRAEHGFSNRGDAMNLSPLLLEKYVAVAGEIVNSPFLAETPIFHALIADPAEVISAPQRPAVKATFEAKAERDFASNKNLKATADGASTALYQFKSGVSEGFDEGMAGVFTAEGSATVAARQPMAVRFGRDFSKTLLLTPDQDVWIAAFATAQAASGKSLLTNKVRRARSFAFDLAVADGAPGEGVTELGLAVLSRNQASGSVTITAHYTGGGKQVETEEIGEQAGADNTFYAFQAPAGQSITRLGIDGSRFSGDFVLLDDIGFVTATRVAPLARKEHTARSERGKGASVPISAEIIRARLSEFLPRVFRRPLLPGELDRYAQCAAGAADPETGMKQALQAALASPSFLYLSPSQAASSPAPIRPLDDYELASRLSYFLWASTPDDELLAVAQRGELAQPEILAAQTRRMLRDPKVRELSESFGVQWLRLDQLYTSKPDAKLFKAFYSGPQGKDTAHGSMLVEALLLFETILIENRSVLEFIDPGWSYLNPRLTKLYGLARPAPAGTEAATAEVTREVKKPEKDNDALWRRTALADKTRGGVLSLGATLTLTSLPVRTSPVKRGAWLLETVFNRPPLEPKVAFVLKDEQGSAAQEMTVRQRFEAHRSKAECYSCHVRLDPPGFALEAFSPIGTVRTNDGALPVDASGTWNGRAFDGPAGFKAAVMARPEEFVRGFIEHLLSYALGRRLEYFDMATVDEIQRATAPDGWRFGTILAEVVKSYPFRNMRNDTTTTASIR